MVKNLKGFGHNFSVLLAGRTTSRYLINDVVTGFFFTFQSGGVKRPTAITMGDSIPTQR